MSGQDRGYGTLVGIHPMCLLITKEFLKKYRVHTMCWLITSVPKAYNVLAYYQIEAS